MKSDISQAFQEELTCFIYLSCLTEPVTISCGHSFCRACLQLSWEDTQLPVHCPMCQEPCQQKEMRINIVLKKLVSIARQASLMKDLSSEEHKCVSHKEIKRIFCVESRIFLCQFCSNSHEHRGHRHCPIEAAAEDQMERLLKQMASLWEKIQENREDIETENRTTTLWMDYVTLWEEMIRTEHRELHPLLCEEEEKHIECIRKEGQCVLEKLRKSKAMMVQKSKELREMFQELMAMSQEPYVVLLQGVNDMVRSESMQLSMPKDMEPELSALPITGLNERCKHIQVHILFENVTTFDSKINLFNISREFSFGPHLKDTSVHSVGCYLAFWGSLKFISGKYYWEVDLQDSGYWAVGVCEDSWLRNTNQMIDSEGAFLLVCMKEGNHYSLLTTCPRFGHPEKPLGRVGVLLDCEDGCLSFMNVAKSSLIYKYPAGTFKNPVQPFFSNGHEERTFNPEH
nr:tripartite motif-containing protein 43-like [Peromyscus maniculatus bairdii]